MFKYLALIFITIFAISFASPVLALDPLVPCGGVGQPLCTTCDFLVLGKNISDFVLDYLTPAIAALLFIYAGFEMLLGGGIPARVDRGRKVFQTTAYGLLIIFLAWLIVNTVLRTVAGDENIAQNWWKLECRENAEGNLVPSDKERLPPPAPGQTIAEDLVKGQPLAQELLSLGVNFSTSADCGGNFHARQNIQDIANGNFPAVCSATCQVTSCPAGGPNGNISVNWRILEGLKGLHQYLNSKYGASFTVHSLTTGIHSANSDHYQGEGLDIKINSSNSTVWKDARFYLNGFGGISTCERKTDSKDESNCNLNLINHIHWTLHR